MFVVRTAGNLLGGLEIGSIEYAVEHLGVKQILVMGHRECGAVKAFVEGGQLKSTLFYVGTAIGSVLTARRIHQPTERALMGQGGLWLALVAVIGFVWPRVLAWPLSLILLWFALALIGRSLRRRRRSEAAEPESPLGPKSS